MDYQIDVGYTQVQHQWIDSHAKAQYQPDMISIGFTAWFNETIGVRVAYGKMQRAFEVTGGGYSQVALDFKGINSLELVYKFQVTDSVYVFGGIGTYTIPMNHKYYDTDMENVIGGRVDSDDDEGGFGGIHYSFNKTWGVEYRYTSYSRIDGGDYHDEYTEGHSVQLTFKF